MKRSVFIVFLAAFLAFGLCSCAKLLAPPETVGLEDGEYRLCYADGTLYPGDDVYNEIISGEPDEKIGSYRFCRIDDAEYDCYVTYDTSGRTFVYFSTEDYDEAKEYYNDPENYSYYCMIGNLHDVTDHTVYEIPDVDTEKFEELYAFALENQYDPFSSSGENSELRTLPFDTENWTDGEIRFYKDSKDGALFSDRGIIFRIEEEKLVLLYYYYGGEDMYVLDVPKDLGDYFIGVVNGLE